MAVMASHSVAWCHKADATGSPSAGEAVWGPARLGCQHGARQRSVSNHRACDVQRQLLRHAWPGKRAVGHFHCHCEAHAQLQAEAPVKLDRVP